jgi:hypothetical protein
VNIDNGLLRAFLLISDYKHGARSMETVIAMSNLIDKTSFDRSSLPPEDQLNLHLNGREFFSIMHRIELDGELLERLAKAAHEVFCDNLLAQGYTRHGKTTQKEKKKHSSLMSYDKLPEEEKEQNRNNVKDIPNKLASIGYTLLPARGDQVAHRLTKAESEKLAKMEHERWVQEKLSAGWKYAKKTNEAKKLHQCIIDWDKLSEEEKDKDRAVVMGSLMRGDQVVHGFTKAETEKLARMEHERWMKQKLNAEWQYTPKTDKAKKLHQCLVEWDKLPEEEKDKDRVLIREIPRIIAKAGYTIAKLH